MTKPNKPSITGRLAKAAGRAVVDAAKRAVPATTVHNVKKNHSCTRCLRRDEAFDRSNKPCCHLTRAEMM